MMISNFDDLLATARQQPTAQRLLLVFATTGLPEDPTAEQRAGFEQGFGGALAPAMCVDKAPDEITDFVTLKREAEQFEMPWRMVFASSLSGTAHQAPSSEETELVLQQMVESIKLGVFANMVAFDVEGRAVVVE